MVVFCSIAEIAKRLSPLFQRPEIRLVVLFGSRAKARSRPSSDLDLGIRVINASTVFTALERDAVRLLATDRVDVVDLRRASPLLAMGVAIDGIALYERDPGEFASFASLAARRYNDTAKLRKLRETGIGTFLNRGELLGDDSRRPCRPSKKA